MSSSSSMDIFQKKTLRTQQRAKSFSTSTTSFFLLDIFFSLSKRKQKNSVLNLQHSNGIVKNKQ